MSFTVLLCSLQYLNVFPFYIYVIFLPSRHSQNNLDQWYQGSLSLVVLCAYPRRGHGIESRVSSLFILRKTTLTLPSNLSWWNKMGWKSRRSYQTVARGIPHTTKERDDGYFHPDT
jgi:hypothetical protein